MANAPKRDDADQRVEAALTEFVTRAKKVPSLAAIAYLPGTERDLFAFIDERDLDVVERLLDIEDELFDLFDDDVFDLHVRYLEGRPYQQSVSTNSRVVYERA